jgi:uncharacterized protein
MNEGAMQRLTELLPELTYDVCVLTGDYRGATFGPFDAALDGLARVRSHLKDWESECCSTNANAFYAAIRRSI